MIGARQRFTTARVGRLATVDHHDAPHVVPVCFALEGDVAYFAVDQKPKRTRRLKRLENIAREPRVALLVDHYEDTDWRRLWWARADGRAQEVDDPRQQARALELLMQRYPQYRQNPPRGTIVAIHVQRWSHWSASEEKPA